jgi:hypothetical protein
MSCDHLVRTGIWRHAGPWASLGPDSCTGGSQSCLKGSAGSCPRRIAPGVGNGLQGSAIPPGGTGSGSNGCIGSIYHTRIHPPVLYILLIYAYVTGY